MDLLKLAGFGVARSDGQPDPMPREELETLLEAAGIYVGARQLDAAERAWLAGRILLAGR